ncbi:glyoxalase [alpha proteobacterium U9-1i]|nr:glyoxalase [alpha proteobacterium U9-1i]
MAKVLGVGGVFYKAANPPESSDWFKRVLGLEFHDWGGVVFTPEAAAAHPGAGTVFSPFKQSTDYFEPSTREFMINFMVDDLDGVLARCKDHGVEPVKMFPDEANGRFAHILGPDGMKIELWQPKPMPEA